MTSLIPPRTGLWLLLVGLCAAVYLLGLGSFYAPTNGDEMVYLHIARKTAETGQWLPLASDIADTRNTKPPLLIWQAMVAGGWGDASGQWTLVWMRAPSILYTLATTALLGALVRRMGGTLRTACLAACIYLAFYSTFRYGRVYLTSAPETFWLNLPLWALLWQRTQANATQRLGDWGAGMWIGTGLAWGIGLLYKSFALVAPTAATLWLAMLLTQPWQWRSFWRISLGHTLACTLALGLFALWFVLDPDPASVWQEFIVAENAAKMSRNQGWWQAALNGDYPLWQHLLAYPENAALLALPVLGLGWAGVQRWLQMRKAPLQLDAAHVVLLVWLAVWWAVFAIPSQRSERYVIPAMPALAVFMALYWERIARGWFWLGALLLPPAVVLLARIAWVMHDMGIASGSELAILLIAACACITGVIATFFIKNWARTGALVSVLAVYACLNAMVAPLGKPALQYSATVQQRLAGKAVAVPNNFTGSFERFHFALPASRITAYDAEGRNRGELYPDMQPDARLQRLLSEFDAVVWLQENLSQTQPTCVPQCTVLGSRWHIKSRHKSGEITLDNLWQPQQWLFRQEWLVAMATP